MKLRGVQRIKDLMHFDVVQDAVENDDCHRDDGCAQYETEAIPADLVLAEARDRAQRRQHR